MNKKQALAVGGAAAVSLLMAGTAFAATPVTPLSPRVQGSHLAGKGTHKFTGIKKSAGMSGMLGKQALTNATFGTVASVTGSSFTLTQITRTATTTVTIGTNSSTTFKKNGQADTFADLAVGQRVVVMGTKDISGNISNATSVNIMIRPIHTATKTKTKTPA